MAVFSIPLAVAGRVNPSKTPRQSHLCHIGGPALTTTLGFPSPIHNYQIYPMYYLVDRLQPWLRWFSF